MERYIKKINDRLIESGNEKNAKKVKFTFQLSGGLLIALGLAGFIASFITFMVLFFKFQTENAFIAWMVAVPFLVMIVIGAVLARIGDTLLPENKTSIDNIIDLSKQTLKRDKSDKVKKDTKNNKRPKNENKTQVLSETEDAAVKDEEEQTSDSDAESKNEDK